MRLPKRVERRYRDAAGLRKTATALEGLFYYTDSEHYERERPQTAEWAPTIDAIVVAMRNKADGLED